MIKTFCSLTGEECHQNSGYQCSGESEDCYWKVEIKHFEKEENEIATIIKRLDMIQKSVIIQRGQIKKIVRTMKKVAITMEVIANKIKELEENEHPPR